MISILKQNSYLVWVEKPAGVLSVPSRMGKADARPVLGLILEKQLGKTVFPLHRLDFEVSGLMLFALEAEAHRYFSKIWEKHLVQKVYQATTWGENREWIVGQTGVWTSKLERGKRRAYEADWGKESITYFEVLKITPVKTPDQGGFFEILWRLEPKTGRSHQLRYELAKHGHPILGDTLYGSRSPKDQDWSQKNAIALRSVDISFKNSNDEELKKYLSTSLRT
jgi:tRNA pseudouridine32 synthase/23S rRNA pseudouridine746 synthase